MPTTTPHKPVGWGLRRWHESLAWAPAGVHHRRVPRWTVAVALVAALVVGCGGSRDTTPGGTTAKTHRPNYAMVGSGKLVAIGGGRRLYLDCAGIAPPYVLVGHSYGGLLVRLFARAHPDQTAGVGLVDEMGRDQTRRQLALW